jgi:hypothetical protein
MNNATLFAAAARYVQPLMSKFSLLGESGGWWSPSGTYQFSRNYLNGVGTATGVGEVSGSQGYVFGRVGPVFNATPADEIALTGEIGWQRLSTDGYLEALSNGNPFNATVSSGADTMNVVKARGQWTHAFTPAFDATIWADYAHGFNYSTSLSATVEGIGTLSPGLSSLNWAEYGVRVGYHATDRFTVEAFLNGVSGSNLDTRVHFGGGFKLVF